MPRVPAAPGVIAIPGVGAGSSIRSAAGPGQAAAQVVGQIGGVFAELDRRKLIADREEQRDRATAGLLTDLEDTNAAIEEEPDWRNVVPRAEEAFRGIQENRIDPIEDEVVRDRVQLEFDLQKERFLARTRRTETRKQQGAALEGMRLALDAYKRSIAATTDPEERARLESEARKVIRMQEFLTEAQKNAEIEAFSKGAAEGFIARRFDSARVLAEEGRFDEARDVLDGIDESLGAPLTDKEQVTIRESIAESMTAINKIEQAQRLAPFVREAEDLEILIDTLDEQIEAGRTFDLEAMDARVDQLRDLGIITSSKRVEMGGKIESARLKGFDVNTQLEFFEGARAGLIEVNPFSTEDRDAINLGFERIFVPEIASLPEEEQSLRTLALIGKTKIIPDQLVGQIQKGLTSSDDGTVFKSADALNRIRSFPNGPVILRTAGFTENQIGEAIEVTDQVRFGIEPRDAIANMRKSREVTKELRDARRAEFSQFLSGDGVKSAIRDELNRWYRLDPEIPDEILAAAQSVALRQHLRTGNVDQAAKTGATLVASIADKTNIDGSSRWMMYAPEPFYEVSGVGNDWMREELISDFKQEFPDFETWLEDGEIRIRTDLDTPRDVDANGRIRPTYQVERQPPTESVTILTARTGNWFPDYSQSQEKVRRDEERRQTIEKARQKDLRLREKEARGEEPLGERIGGFVRGVTDVESLAQKIVPPRQVESQDPIERARRSLERGAAVGLRPIASLADILGGTAGSGSEVGE